MLATTPGVAYRLTFKYWCEAKNHDLQACVNQVCKRFPADVAKDKSAVGFLYFTASEESAVLFFWSGPNECFDIEYVEVLSLESHVKTICSAKGAAMHGVTCASLCRNQGHSCIRAQSRAAKMCEVDEDNIEPSTRQSPEDGGCHQIWPDQVCQCVESNVSHREHVMPKQEDTVTLSGMLGVSITMQTVDPQVLNVVPTALNRRDEVKEAIRAGLKAVTGINSIEITAADIVLVDVVFRCDVGYSMALHVGSSPDAVKAKIQSMSQESSYSFVVFDNEVRQKSRGAFRVTGAVQMRLEPKIVGEFVHISQIHSVPQPHDDKHSWIIVGLLTVIFLTLLAILYFLIKRRRPRKDPVQAIQIREGVVVGDGSKSNGVVLGAVVCDPCQKAAPDLQQHAFNC